MQKVFIKPKAESFVTFMARLVKAEFDFEFVNNVIQIPVLEGGDLEQLGKDMQELFIQLDYQIWDSDTDLKFVLFADRPSDNVSTYHVMTNYDLRTQEDYIYVDILAELTREQLVNLDCEISKVL